MKLTVFILCTALVAVSYATVIPTTPVPVEVVKEDFPVEFVEEDHINDFDDELPEDFTKEENDPEKTEVNFDDFTDEELEAYMEAEDEKLAGELDIYTGINEIKERKNALGLKRRKRWIPLALGAGRLAFSAGRAFLRRYASNGITHSGSRMTKHYSRPGNYFSGLREFKKLNPTNVKPIQGSKFKGWTGTAGNYRVTVRSGSKGKNGVPGGPTLSLSNKGGDLVRKFRFD